MVWSEITVMAQREEFVSLAGNEGINFSRLCARFGVSRKTGYKWLGRAQGREAGTWSRDHSRRPLSSPWRCASPMEEAVLGVRAAHPAWGGRKIRRRLELDGFS